MNKIQQAKQEQEYNPKPIVESCSNCKHFTSDKIPQSYGYIHETNIRCSIGGFAVKKMGVCKLHEFNH